MLTIRRCDRPPVPGSVIRYETQVCTVGLDTVYIKGWGIAGCEKYLAPIGAEAESVDMLETQIIVDAGDLSPLPFGRIEYPDFAASGFIADICNQTSVGRECGIRKPR